MMVLKDIKCIDDVSFLKNNKISEDIDLDYKKKLPDLSVDEGRIEFLRDVCSFANTHGGQLIFGIEEDGNKAIPHDVCGVILSKPDHQIRRLIEIVRNGIEEVISGIHFNPIPLEGDNYVVVMKIPISLNCPHRVKGSIDSDHRFYGRNSRGKYELSFYEIREKFMQSATIRDKIHKFRYERIAMIKDKQAPIQLKSGPKIVFHIIPLSAFASVSECDPSQIRKIYQNNDTYGWFSPFGLNQGGTKSEINLDGFLAYQNNDGYVQIYREGIVEAVSMMPQVDGDPMVHSGFYEPSLLKQKYFDILTQLNFTGPCCIFLSMLEINGCLFSFPSKMGFGGGYNVSTRKFNKSEIILKEVIFDSADNSLENLFRPLFDRFCNAWGLPECANYNQEGGYIYN